MVLTLARSLAVTSSMVWLTFRPLIAANMPRIIETSPPCGMRRPRREVRPRVGLGCAVGPPDPRYRYDARHPASRERPAAPGSVSRCTSSDHRGVDVREHVVAHVPRVDRRDDGAVRHAHDE